jgi:hypothetical protein
MANKNEARRGSEEVACGWGASLDFDVPEETKYSWCFLFFLRLFLYNKQAGE